MKMLPFSASMLALAACLIPQTSPPAGAVTPASQGEIEAQQHEAFARSAGYPTRKTQGDLDAMIAQQTKDYRLAAKRHEGRLDAAAPITITGARGTCYTVVFRLADGATWGRGAEAGLRFDFQGPSGQGSGGPGVAGPGAVASVGCLQADGAVTLTMAPMIGHDPIGQGAFTYEVWSHVLTAKEAKAREADQQRQIAEQREYAAREAQRKHDQETQGCARCAARYEGCIGAGRPSSTCRSEYSSCGFEEAGPDYLSACPNPR